MTMRRLAPQPAFTPEARLPLPAHMRKAAPAKAPAFPPTDEQAAILEAGRGSANILINALAGTGKTATLELLETAVRERPIQYIAFNKRIAEEAQKRMTSTTTVRTFNSAGHRVWANSIGRATISLDNKKTQTLLREVANDKTLPRGTRDAIWGAYWDVVNAVAMAKTLGYVPEGKYDGARRLISRGDFHASLDEEPDDLIADLTDSILTKSIHAAYQGQIDYNDQIYMPACFGGTFPRFPLIMVDEAQDMSPANHALLDRLCTGRLIAVGDPNQNIYGFRGAVANGMETLREKYSMQEFDLSISFRCPSEIVEGVHWHVPKFRAFRSGGSITSPMALDPDDIPADAVILCRNNAPLFRFAMRLLGRGRSVSVAGSDIGPKLIAILRKLGQDHDSRSVVLGAIEAWEAEREGRGSKTAADIAECMRVFASFGETLSQAVSYAEHLFAQKGSIRLMTIHKSKGLEFPLVYHLDPWLVRKPGRGPQEANLDYVATTRSSDRLIEIDSAAVVWES